MEQTPFMKAMYAFARADPDDCRREWAACLALVSNDETASDSSPTNSTSSLAPAVVSASSTERSTVSLHGPSSATSKPTTPDASRAVLNAKCDSSKDDLTPGARRIYDYLVGDSAAPPTTDVSTNLLVRTEVDAVHDAVNNEGTHLAASTPSTCSTICLAGDTSATTTPASSTTVSTNLLVSTELDAVRDAVGIGRTDLTAPTPTICLPECPSRGASHLEVELSSSATAASSTRCCFDPEPAAGISTPSYALDLLEEGASTSSLTGDQMVLKFAPITVDTNTTYLAAVVPICLSECPSHDDVVSVSVFNSYATQALDDCSGRSIDKPPSLLAEACKVFNEVPSVTEIVPWPPPSWNRAITPLIRGQNLFQHAQQKHGKEFSVMDSKGNWIAIWLDVELKPPWSFLGVCMNLPMGWIYQHIFQGNTHYSEQMRWSFSHSVLQFQFCTALVQSENFWTINLVPLKSWFQCCCAQRESIYGCENFQWTIAWSLSCPFSQSISWSFSCPPWEDELLPDSTRRVFLSSSEKCQLKIARLLDFAFTEWKPWPSRVCFCVVYVSTSACGPGAPLFWWFQFAIKNSFVFRDKLLLNITIQLQPWPSWQESNYTLASKRVRIQWSILNVNWALEELSRMTNWASEEEKGKLLLSVPWLSFRCHWVAACPALLGKIPPGHPHEDPYGFAGSFVLHWTSFSDETQMQLFTENFCYKFFAIWETRDCLQYEHLQQWRPPHQLTSVACIGALFLRSKDCWSDIHWVQLFVIEHWLIPWEPGNDSRGHNLMICVTITCELLYSVDDKLQADRYLCLSMRCVQVDTDGSGSCVSFLQPKPPWLLLAPTIYASGFKSYLTIASESVHITSVSLEINQCGVTAIHGSRAYGCLDFARKLTGLNFICLLGLYFSYVQYITQDTHYFGFQQTATGALPMKQPIGGHCKFYDAFLFNWDLTSTIGSVPAVKYISGGSVPVLDSATCVSWNNTPQQFLHLTWDPGGYRQHPLEGKPDFKEGGLSTTCLQELSHGPSHWAVACFAARYEDREAYIPMERPHQDLAKNESEKAASAEARVARVACVVLRCSSSFLLDPSSSLMFL